jgi:hypothetical protein
VHTLWWLGPKRQYQALPFFDFFFSLSLLFNMSFNGWKKYIEEGDLVIVYMVKEKAKPLLNTACLLVTSLEKI